MSRILNIKTTERKRNVGLNITEKTPECVTPVDYFMMVALLALSWWANEPRREKWKGARRCSSSSMNSWKRR